MKRLLRYGLCFLTLFVGIAKGEDLLTTKVFILPILPTMFNWTIEPGDHFEFSASLLDAPDLPNWIQYFYSNRQRTGFLFGVPPRDKKDVEVEIIGQNRRTYETSRRVVHLNIDTKPNPALREVNLKIDNLNIDDFFDSYRTNQLLDIFKHKLWKDSFADLYMTFLTSAVTLGARLPLRPSEGEGVVLRLGSTAPFSNTLIELQEEVKPLWKLQFCPRDFKRTTVERIFREEGFVLDWCSFKLLDEAVESSDTSVEHTETGVPPELDKIPLWSQPRKDQVPERSYAGDLSFSILIPLLIMTVLVVVLSFILCLQREEDGKGAFIDGTVEMSQYAATPRPYAPTTTLRSLSANREVSPDVNTARRSPRQGSPHTNRTDAVNGSARPSPPPYTGTMRSSHVDF